MAKHGSSTWRKSAIMPIWSVQLALLSIDLIICALYVCIEKNTPDQTVKFGGKNVVLTSGVESWTAANLSIASISLLFTCIEIILYINLDLSPLLFVSSCSIKTLLWTVTLILDIVAVNSEWAKGEWNNYLLYAGIGFAGLAYIALIVGLVFGAVVFKRHRGAIALNFDKSLGSGEIASDYRY